MPTQGRVVIYRQAARETAVNGQREHPAVITQVWSEQCVNLRVLFDSPPSPADWQTSVPRTDVAGEDYPGGTWHWPERA